MWEKPSVLSMTSWHIELITGPSRQFYDLKTRIGQYYELKSGWIRKLQQHIKNFDCYNVHAKSIQTVKGPKSKKIYAPFILLLVAKTGLTITFLGELTEKDTGYILGIWPQQFFSILEKDPQAIMNLLYMTVEQPDLVTQLDLFF